MALYIKTHSIYCLAALYTRDKGNHTESISVILSFSVC